MTVYLASGVSKLIDGDWWSGRVLQLRVIDNGHRAVDAGVPEWIIDAIDGASFHAVFAKVVVATELAIGIGLPFRRTRRAAVLLAIAFHISIQLFAEVQVFSWAALAALLVWVTPERAGTSAPPGSEVGAGGGPGLGVLEGDHQAIGIDP